MRWIGRKLTLDRVLQRWLRQHSEPTPDEDVVQAHDRLMQAVLHTPQDPALRPEPRSRRPFFGGPQPTYPAVALSVAMLALGVLVGQSAGGASPQQSDVVQKTVIVNGGQKVSVLAMASPWGDWIEEGGE